MKLQIKRLNQLAILPTQGTIESAGWDIYAATDKPVTVHAGKMVMLPTALALAIPIGYVGLVFARSGLASKKGLAPANKVGVIDSDYRGELMVSLFNHGTLDQVIMPHDRIAQLVVVPYLQVELDEVDSLDNTARGKGGFGSTGN